MRKYIPLALVIVSWLLSISAYFFLSMSGKAQLNFALCALPAIIASMVAVVLYQSASAPSFYAALASLIVLILFLISPLIKPLSPIRAAGESAVGALSRVVLGVDPYDGAHPAKTVQDWVAIATSPTTGKKLNFKIFPNIPEWTQVCIFPGHSTDAQFLDLIPLQLPWKLSDKSMSTTKREFSAIAFVDDKTKNVIHIQDIQQSDFVFDPSVHRKCFPYSRSTMKRTKEAVQEHGPTFAK